MVDPSHDNEDPPPLASAAESGSVAKASTPPIPQSPTRHPKLEPEPSSPAPERAISESTGSRHNSRSSSTSSTSSSSSEDRRPRVVVGSGVQYLVFHPDDKPEAIVLGTKRKATSYDPPDKNAEKKRKLKTCAVPEDSEEGRWRKRRKMILAEELFKGLPAEEDVVLPDWINAERERQDDDQPGVYLLKPSRADYDGRFEEMIEAVHAVGQRHGCIKVKVPEGSNLPPPPPPPAGDPEPQVLSTTQFVPLHSASPDTPHFPLYHVFAHHPETVSLSSFPHSHDARTSFSRIPETFITSRDRTWSSQRTRNPSAAVHYSTDNSATAPLRAHLGLSNPHLETMPGNILAHSSPIVEGIHTPYLYLGNGYTMFALHQEDFSASSLNYHHYGAPKMWRVFSPVDFTAVEEMVAAYTNAKGEWRCSQAVRHDAVFVSEGLCRQWEVRSMLVRQKAGELVVTWPGAYHQGWNEGVNVCEAVAYGSEKWKQVFFHKGHVREEVYRQCWAECGCGGEASVVMMEFPEDMDTEKEEGVKMEETTKDAPVKTEDGVKVEILESAAGNVRVGKITV